MNEPCTIGARIVPCEGEYSKIPIRFYPAEQDVYSILTSYPSRYYRAGATPED